jgi:hypothetical protein
LIRPDERDVFLAPHESGVYTVETSIFLAENNPLHREKEEFLIEIEAVAHVSE